MHIEPSLPSPLPQELLTTIVRGGQQGHAIVARSHVEDEGWNNKTWGVNRHELSQGWIIFAAAALEGVTVDTDRGGTRHLCCGGYRLSFHNGGTDRRWDIHTYDFERSDARKNMAQHNGAQMSLFGLVADLDDEGAAKLRELDVILVGNPHHGLEVIYIGAPTRRNGESRWGWVPMLWQRDELPGAGDQYPGGPIGGSDSGGGRRFETFRDIPDADIPPLTVRPQPARVDEGDATG